MSQEPKADSAEPRDAETTNTSPSTTPPPPDFEFELNANGEVTPIVKLVNPSTSVQDASPISTTPPPSTRSPVAPNPEEIALPLTEDQKAEIAMAENLGAGKGAAEGAANAGIALADVDSQTEGDVKMDGVDEVGSELSKKREQADGSDDEDPASKRPRLSSPPPRISQPQELDPSLPFPSNHVSGSHPPTRSLYITNLRRPLPDQTLSTLLDAFGPFDLKAGYGKNFCGWWLSPVKSHAFVSYIDAESARKAYEGLQGLKSFPPEAIQPTPELKVEFLSTAVIPSLVEKEEEEWKHDRKKLDLVIRKEEGEKEEWVFEYLGAGNVSMLGVERTRVGMGVGLGRGVNGPIRPQHPNFGVRPPHPNSGIRPPHPNHGIRPQQPPFGHQPPPHFQPKFGGAFRPPRPPSFAKSPGGFSRPPPTGPAPPVPKHYPGVPQGPSGNGRLPGVNPLAPGGYTGSGWGDRKKVEKPEVVASPPRASEKEKSDDGAGGWGDSNEKPRTEVRDSKEVPRDVRDRDGRDRKDLRDSRDSRNDRDDRDGRDSRDRRDERDSRDRRDERDSRARDRRDERDSRRNDRFVGRREKDTYRPRDEGKDSYRPRDEDRFWRPENDRR